MRRLDSAVRRCAASCATHCAHSASCRRGVDVVFINLCKIAWVRTLKTSSTSRSRARHVDYQDRSKIITPEGAIFKGTGHSTKGPFFDNEGDGRQHMHNRVLPALFLGRRWFRRNQDLFGISLHGLEIFVRPVVDNANAEIFRGFPRVFWFADGKLISPV